MLEEAIPMCRICFERENEREENPLISPCRCKGTIRWVHFKCLKKWRRYLRKAYRDKSRTKKCDICKADYKFTRNWYHCGVYFAAVNIVAYLTQCYFQLCLGLVTIYFSLVRSILFLMHHFAFTLCLFLNWCCYYCDMFRDVDKLLSVGVVVIIVFISFVWKWSILSYNVFFDKERFTANVIAIFICFCIGKFLTISFCSDYVQPVYGILDFYCDKIYVVYLLFLSCIFMFFIEVFEDLDIFELW